MKSRSISLLLLIFLFSTSASVACKTQKPTWKGTIAEKEGVVIVKNPKEPLYPNAGVRIVQDLKIGQRTGKPEYMFSDVISIEVDAQGRIYAADYKERNIRVFDRNGVYLRTIGRPGQGPGEFDGGPRHLRVSPAGEIMATDDGSRSIKVFSSDGTYLRQYLLKTLSPVSLDYGSGEIFYVMSYSMEPIGFKLFRFDGRTEESSALATWEMPFPDPKRASIFDPGMSFAVMPDDRLLYGCPTEGYEILIFSPQGRLERRVLKDWDPQPITAEEKEDVLSFRKKRSGLAQIQMEFPKSHPPYRVVACDDQQHIIVHVYSKLTVEPGTRNETLFDIFDKEGRYLARFRYPFQTLVEKPMLWRGGKFYMVESDEDGYIYIVRYAVDLGF